VYERTVKLGRKEVGALYNRAKKEEESNFAVIEGLCRDWFTMADEIKRLQNIERAYESLLTAKEEIKNG